MRAPVRHIAVALAFVATYGFTRAITPVAPATPANLGELPMRLANWAGVTAPPLAPEVVAVLAADSYIRRWYGRDLRSATGNSRFDVEMDVSYYAQPRIGANMHSPLNCLPGNGWAITRMATVPLPGANGVSVRALTVERGTSRFAMAYWFQSRERVITGEGSTRFQLLADALRRQPTDAGLVRVMAPLTTSTAGEKTVLEFASRLVPELAKVFRRT